MPLQYSTFDIVCYYLMKIFTSVEFIETFYYLDNLPEYNTNL